MMSMSMAALVIGLAFVAAIGLALFFLGVMVARGFSKPKRAAQGRLTLANDGELIDFSDDQDADTKARHE